MNWIGLLAKFLISLLFGFVIGLFMADKGVTD